jgi:hypothetical protein
MHEDLKLNKLRDSTEGHRIAKMLIKLAIGIEPYKKAAYVQYYIADHAKELKREDIEAEIKKAYKDGKIMKEGVELEPVPKLIKWIEQALKGPQD